jgi:hypothetical protein
MKVDDVLKSAPTMLPFLATEQLMPVSRPHWSVAAAILGRMADEKLVDKPLEAWAKDALDMARGEVRLALLLWRIMQRGYNDGIAFDRWQALTKSKALLLDEVFRAGGDRERWFQKAASGSLETFEHEVDRHLSRQPFTTLKFRVPVELVPVIKAALKRTLPEVLEGEAPASNDPNSERYWLDLIEDPKYEFRCLEVLAAHAMQTLPEPEFEG